jgi:hypothetical protein
LRARAGWLRLAALCAAWGASAGCTDTGGDGDARTPAEVSVAALPNGALRFDGIADYATTGTAGFPTAGTPQTISLWVKYTGGSTTQVFVSLHRDNASGVNLGILGGQITAWNVYANRLLVQTSVLPAAGSWHHIAFVLERGDAGGPVETLYVDGASVATAMTTADKLTPLSSFLGSLDGLSDFFAGDLDDVRIWNVARTSAEVAADMNGTTAADAPGLVAYFDCNTIRGTRVPDRSGSGNDATLGGGDATRMPALVASTTPE